MNDILRLVRRKGTSSRSSLRWAVTLAVLLLWISGCSGPFPQTTFSPITDFGTAIDDLFVTIFWFAVFVFVVVEAVLLFTVLRFRERPGQPDPEHLHGHTALEIGWTLAPALIIVLIAVPTIQTIFEVDGTPEVGALEVQVVGHQWWWEFQYPELGIVTANELHLPQGRPVSLVMTSADVIHSFWVPRLGGKRDLINSRTTRISFTPDSVGTFLGQCAEFCGVSHANMRMRVMVDSPEDWEAWVANQQSGPVAVDTTANLVRLGEEAFRKIRDPANNSCIACHAVQGVSAGVLGPNLTHLGSRTTIAAGILRNDAEGLTRWLRDPTEVKPGSLMPDVGLTDEEVAALVAYLQSLK